MRNTSALGTLFRSRQMWALLAVAFIALLAVGSVHGSTATPEQRTANLESVLKCPSCADASLAQSETVSANEIKATIAKWVRQGVSDQTIEARMVATYGQGELLRPTGSAIWVVPAVVVALAFAGLISFFARRRPSEKGVSKEDEERVLALLKHRSDSRVAKVGHDG